MSTVYTGMTLYYVNTKTGQLHHCKITGIDMEREIWLAADPELPGKRLEIDRHFLGRTVFIHADDALEAWKKQKKNTRKAVRRAKPKPKARSLQKPEESAMAWYLDTMRERNRPNETDNWYERRAARRRGRKSRGEYPSRPYERHQRSYDDKPYFHGGGNNPASTETKVVRRQKKGHLEEYLEKRPLQREDDWSKYDSKIKERKLPEKD